MMGVAGALAVWGEADRAGLFLPDKGIASGVLASSLQCQWSSVSSLSRWQSGSSQWCLVRGWVVTDINWNKSFRLDIKKNVWDGSLTEVLVDNIHCYPCISQTGNFIAEVSNWSTVASCWWIHDDYFWCFFLSLMCLEIIFMIHLSISFPGTDVRLTCL